MKGKTYQDGKTINNSILNDCSNIFGKNCFFKIILMYLSNKVVGKEFSFQTSFR